MDRKREGGGVGERNEGQKRYLNFTGFHHQVFQSHFDSCSGPLLLTNPPGGALKYQINFHPSRTILPGLSTGDSDQNWKG